MSSTGNHRMKLPIILTYSRIALVPVFALIFYLPFSWAHITSAVVFTIAALTDWLDGYLARKFQQTTSLGAVLDPVADKLLVAVALVILVGESQLPLLTLPAAIIVGREIIVSGLREWMAEIGKRASVKVTYISKLKTAAQMVALVALLAYTPNVQVWLGIVGYTLLWIAALLTLWTMFVYIKIAWPELYPGKEAK